MKFREQFLLTTLFLAAALVSWQFSVRPALAACDPTVCDCAAGLQAVPAGSCSTACLSSHNANGTVNCYPTVGSVAAPGSWLSTLDPGFGPKASSGIEFFTGNLLPFLIKLVLWGVIVLALIFVIIGGIKWMMAGGDKEGLAKAKNTLTFALLGLGLALASALIVAVIGQIFGVDLLGTGTGATGNICWPGLPGCPI